MPVLPSIVLQCSVQAGKYLRTMAPHPDVGEGAKPAGSSLQAGFFIARAPQPRPARGCHNRFMPLPRSLSASLQAHLERALSRLRTAWPTDLPWPGEAFETRLAAVALASDFFVDTAVRQPALLRHLADSADPPPLAEPLLDAGNAAEWPTLLRRYRTAESARLVWRDVHGLDSVEATLAGSTRLAERCLALALDALEQQFAQRHGRVYASDGSEQRLVVFGLGKLGGGELNFSSDIDLVYAYPQAG